MEFPGGEGGAKQKTFRGGRYGYFLELHNAGYTEYPYASITIRVLPNL